MEYFFWRIIFLIENSYFLDYSFQNETVPKHCTKNTNSPKKSRLDKIQLFNTLNRVLFGHFLIDTLLKFFSRFSNLRVCLTVYSVIKCLF